MDVSTFGALLKHLQKDVSALNDTLTNRITVTEAASHNDNVVINDLNVIFYPNLKICFVGFNIKVSSDLAHNAVLFTLPETIGEAAVSMDCAISAVNSTSIKARAYVGVRDIKAFGAVASGNYIQGSIAYPTK